MTRGGSAAPPPAVGRLRKRSEFLAVRKGGRASSPWFSVEAAGRGDESLPRVGYTVSKKNGGAVARNRIKRRLREAVRLGAALSMARGHDYVIVARPGAKDAPFAALCAELGRAVEKATRLRPTHRRDGGFRVSRHQRH